MNHIKLLDRSCYKEPLINEVILIKRRCRRLNDWPNRAPYRDRCGICICLRPLRDRNRYPTFRNRYITKVFQVILKEYLDEDYNSENQIE